MILGRAFSYQTSHHQLYLPLCLFVTPRQFCGFFFFKGTIWNLPWPTPPTVYFSIRFDTKPSKHVLYSLFPFLPLPFSVHLILVRLSPPPFHQTHPCGVTRDLHVVIPSGQFQDCVFYDLEVPFDQLANNPSSLESFCPWLPGWHFLRVFLRLPAVHLTFPLLFPSPIQGLELGLFLNSISILMPLGSQPFSWLRIWSIHWDS